MNVVENKTLIKNVINNKKGKNYEECFEKSKESHFMVCE